MVEKHYARATNLVPWGFIGGHLSGSVVVTLEVELTKEVAADILSGKKECVVHVIDKDDGGRIHNPVTGKSYPVAKTSSKYRGKVEGMKKEMKR